MASAPSAAAWALGQVEAVRDDPAARLALTARTYRGPNGHAPQHLPFRRAALSFMRWQLGRGVLAPLTAAPPGSPWWRAVNERLLRDGCEAVARSGGLGGTPSSPAVRLWMSFVSHPTARTWYRAHNASIVSSYLANRELAAGESRPERFFLNVVLLRVLYAHALVAEPRLALGRLGWMGPLLGDPRLGMTGIFLSLSRVLPDRYPLWDDVAGYLAAERNVGQALDYGLIAPRLQQPTSGRPRNWASRPSSNAFAKVTRSMRGPSATATSGTRRGPRSRSARSGVSHPWRDFQHPLQHRHKLPAPTRCGCQ
ncbi:hypothetical protein [Rhizocola hellebori]|uniref:hypothetical protein n=1 Tax=Rhizocola hellebori TaxID=1392758 RepID=UPI0019443006|nr:hypothetical protein [Rhizocola hellebori]